MWNNNIAFSGSGWLYAQENTEDRIVAVVATYLTLNYLMNWPSFSDGDKSLPDVCWCDDYVALSGWRGPWVHVREATERRVATATHGTQSSIRPLPCLRVWVDNPCTSMSIPPNYKHSFNHISETCTQLRYKMSSLQKLTLSPFWIFI